MASKEAVKNVGVYLCECGGNIGDVVDVESVSQKMKDWNKVKITKHDSYLCSKPAQDMIQNDIEKEGLDRIVVASCTPRMHLTTFQEVLKRSGLNPYMLEFVNIREHCSWVHGPHASENATKKAESLIKAGYKRSLVLKPLEEFSEKANKNILIIYECQTTQSNNHT